MTEQRQDRPNAVELKAVSPVEDIPPAAPGSEIVIIFWFVAVAALVVFGIAAILQQLRTR